MNNINKSENELFKNWITTRMYNYFIKDGVIDEETFLKQKTKILFVLKEANCQNGNADFREELKKSDLEGNWWKTWNNIARWSLALLNGEEYPENISTEYRAEVLKRIAFLNLKKVGGGTQAKTNEIIKAAQNDREFIKDQIEIYNPDIVICCGKNSKSNATILREYILNGSVSDWVKMKNSLYYYYFETKNKQIPVVSFWHPQMRGGHKNFKKKYDLMLGVREELLVK